MAGSWSNGAQELIVLVEQVSGYSGIFGYSPAPAAGALVFSLAAASGTDPYGNTYQAGLTVYSTDGVINLFSSLQTWTGSGGGIINIGVGGGQALMELIPETVAGVTWAEGSIGTVITNLSGANTPGLFMSSPYANANTHNSVLELLGGSPSTNHALTRLVSDTFEVVADTHVIGALTADNEAVGSVLITPTAANTPTSVTITYPALTGTTFRGVCSPESVVPGTEVTGWGITSITSTTAKVWATRTNTTQTRIDYIIKGIP